MKTKIIYIWIALMLAPPAFSLDGAMSEFLDKEVKTVSTKGNSKSKNLNITLDYPKSWKVFDRKVSTSYGQLFKR